MQQEKTQKAGQANAQKYFDYYETLRDVVSDIRQGNLITSKKEKITAYRIVKELNARGIETAEKHINGLEKDIPWYSSGVARLLYYLDTGESLNALKKQEKKARNKVLE